MLSRRTFIKGMCGTALGVGAIGSYSHFIEPRWVEVKSVDVKINALPGRFHGMTIAQLSDIHHCKYVPKEFIRQCVRKANALRPDIIVLTGDYVFEDNKYLPPAIKELAGLRAREGIFAIPGNHDDADDTCTEFSKKGIQVLMNKHVPVFRKNEHIFIAGVEDLWRGNMDLEKTWKGTDNSSKILLAHNPDAREAIRFKGVDFSMSGHTHGGQVNLPLYGPPIVYSKFGARYTAGFFQEGNTLMYVNRGIGVSNLPVRFFARPEITLFTLKT